MKNKKMLFIKIAQIVFILLIILLLFYSKTYAISLPSNLTSAYQPNDAATNEIGGRIIWVAQIILYTAAVILVIITGVKYMWAAPEAKAEFKRKLIYLVAGAIILFAAGSLVRIIGNMAFSNI